MSGFLKTPIRRAQLCAATLVAAVFFTAPPTAEADTATDTFQVTASVNAACSVTANDLAFGVYDPFSATPTDGTTTLDVTCTLTTAYDVGLDKGTGSGATVANRKMTSGANTLTYSLYQDAGHATVWGDSGGSLVSGTGTGSAQTYTVYGRIPALQTVPPGSYSDTVTVTVTF